MKQTITFSNFVDAFRDAGREEQFSYEGKRALFDYIDRIEEDTGSEIELDVIALCCEYSEDDFEDIASSYNIDFDEDDDEDDKIAKVIKHLEYHTQYIGRVGNSLVYMPY